MRNHQARLLCLTPVVLSLMLTGVDAEEPPQQFRVWATSCSHVPADIRRNRESLALAIRQSEGAVKNAPAFDWDIMIDAGDLSAHQNPPGDRDGKELIRQYRAMSQHRREQVYNVPGNHDAPYYDHGPGTWFRKWGDPLGENTRFSGVDPGRRPFPVEGNWERYSFQAGNILFLMLADRNDAPEPVGRGHSKDGHRGGYPAGAVTRDTFNWWKQQVLDNQNKIIVTMHHHALRDTTIASGYGEGNPRYHGSSGGAKGSSYLYYLIENDDPDDFRFIKDAHVFEDFLDTFHKKHGRGAIDLWIAGHTHVHGPDDVWGEKTISENRWGVGFLQVAALTVHHGGSHPMSRLLTFTDGTQEAKAAVYLHDTSYRKHPVGWYEPSTTQFQLRHKFQAPAPITRLSPFPENAEVFDEPYQVAPKPKRGIPGHSIKALPSPDLTVRWKMAKSGSVQLEALLQEDAGKKIAHAPTLIEGSPSGMGHSARFDGHERLRLGPIHVEDWAEMSVTAWIRTTAESGSMRIVSKDRIGIPGSFMMWRDLKGSWAMQAWDDNAQKWQVASWKSDLPSDGKWHLISGIVDSSRKKVSLFVDGELHGKANWSATTLDDSDKTDFVIGADSDEARFGHSFRGAIHDVHLYQRALSPEELRQMFEKKGL